MSRILTSKTAVVTGASRGLGTAIARAMWREGASLLLVARSEQALCKLADELVQHATAEQCIRVCAVDLNKNDAISKILAAARASWDALDVLVNNAAVLGPLGVAWENDWDEWQAALQVNLLAPIQLCRECVRWMGERRRGKIVNLSGGGATGPRPNFSAYATAKVGLVRFSEILAHEVQDLNVQVNCVAPGAMNTEMLQAIARAGAEHVGSAEYSQAVRQAAQGGATVARAAQLCVFLSSPASDGITGKLISAVWDPWESLPGRLDNIRHSDI